MKHYGIVELDVTDPAWVDEYVANVTPLVERMGGRYLSRTVRVRSLEGGAPVPQMVVLLEFGSEAEAMAFYDSDEYRPYRDARLAGARNRFLSFPGEDVRGLAAID